MCGSFSVANAVHLGVEVALAVIARTSIARVCIRHHCRGSNSKGEVANFVETEQIVDIEERNGVSSFNILRGSVPLEWSQPLRDVFWKYKITIKDEEEATPVRKHFAALTSRYGSVAVIDLLAFRRDEALLRCAFGRAVSQLPYSHGDREPLVAFNMISKPRAGPAT